MIRIDKMPPPPPQPGDHRACSTPNPPWWCDETPQATIDSGIWLMVLLAILIGLAYYLSKEKD